MNDEVKEILDYFQKDVDKYEESKKYLMEKYGYDEETIDNISQHNRHTNTKKLLDYITNLQQENQKYKEVFDKAIKMIDECACYNEKDKECKCSFSSMAITSLRNILKEVE